MEVGGHPDLIHIGRLLRERMDRTLEAEMHAARAAARRTRTVRDVLLTAEDSESHISATTSDGTVHCGIVTAVGTDHVEISSAESLRVVSISHIVAAEIAR